VSGTSVGKLRVLIGEEVGRPIAVVPVDSVVVREGYSGSVGDPNDIAIVLLASPVSVPAVRIGASSRATDRIFRYGETVEFAGYGFATVGGVLGIGRRTEYRDIVQHWDKSWLRHGGARASSCVGDSGGPAMVQNANGEPVLVGLTSWGGRRCDAVSASIRVDAHAEWIKKHAAVNFDPILTFGPTNEKVVASIAGEHVLDAAVYKRRVYVVTMKDAVAADDPVVDAGGGKTWPREIDLIEIAPQAARRVVLGIFGITADPAAAGRETHTAMSLERGELRVYVTEKVAEDAGRWTVRGVMMTIELVTLSVTKSSVVFEDKNWGWYPHFHGEKLVHFSFSGRYRIVDGVKIARASQPEMREERLASVFDLSAGLLPTDTATFLNRLRDGGTDR